MAEITISEPFGGDFKIPDLIGEAKPELLSDQPTGYYFSGVFYCPDCLLAAMAARRVVSQSIMQDYIEGVAAGHHTLEQALDDLAVMRDVDRSDEHSYGSRRFPHLQHAKHQKCEGCAVALPGPANGT